MNLAILHLSDIHLKKGTNAILAKFGAMRGVIEAHAGDIDACLVAFSGDIAFSGKPAEYAVADDLFKTLAKALAECGVKYHVCCIPGNHDCDFEKADKTRELVLKGVLEDNGASIDDSVLSSCFKVQHSFFQFLERQSGFNAPKSADRLAYSYSFEQDGTKIRVNCINTAWISQLPGTTVGATISDKLPPADA